MCNRARNKAAPEPETLFSATWTAPRPMDNRFNPVELFPKSRAWVVIPVSEFAEWTPDLHDVGGGKPIKGEMWFDVPEQPVFAIAGF